MTGLGKSETKKLLADIKILTLEPGLTYTPMEEPRPSEAEPGLKSESLTSWSHKASIQQPIKPMFFRAWFTHHLHQHHCGCLFKMLFPGAHHIPRELEFAGVGLQMLNFNMVSRV